MRRTDHVLAEDRSIRLHEEIARRLRSEPEIVERARARVERWIRLGDPAPEYARRWLEILREPVEVIARRIVDPGQDARALRQVTPFAGVVPPRERWRIWREVRERT